VETEEQREIVNTPLFNRSEG